MSMVGYYKTLGQIEDRVTERMAELRQAERDAAQYCAGMAFDGNTAVEIYRKALDHVGIPTRDTWALGAAEMRILLKNVNTSRVSHGAPAMAYDSKAHGPSVLDSILAGVKPPRDRSHRNDFRR
jgi:hypothetical protein